MDIAFFYVQLLWCPEALSCCLGVHEPALHVTNQAIAKGRPGRLLGSLVSSKSRIECSLLPRRYVLLCLFHLI